MRLRCQLSREGPGSWLVVGPGALAVQEVVGIDAEGRAAERSRLDQRIRGGPLVGHRGGGGDGAVGAIGGDEVDQRLGVFHRAGEVVPAGVGLQLVLAGVGEELGAGHVQRRHAGVPASRDVQRGEVERQAEQVVLQRSGDELVDRVADLVDRAEHDVGRHVRVAGELRRIGEGLDQAFLRHLRLAGGGSMTGLPSAPST